MSGTSSTAAKIRDRLDHPVLDCDGHVLEHPMALFDFVKDVAGSAVVKRFEDQAKALGPDIYTGVPTRGAFWFVPSGPHTIDRATAMLPRLYYERMDDAGIDFSLLFTTFGLGYVHVMDEEVRRAACRALNTMYAEMFAGLGDRIAPVAVIPTHSPEEAIEELDHAVTNLGFKAVMLNTETRLPSPQIAEQAPHLARFSEVLRPIAMDTPHDYDPVWQKCVDLGVAVAGHTADRGSGHRHSSPSNYIFNHLGCFASGNHYFARSLLLGGVTRRFPQLNFAFMEGGVAWASALYNDAVEHYEKRNIDTMLEWLDPEKLDIELLADMVSQYGDGIHLTADRIRAQPHINVAKPAEEGEVLDEWAACEMTGPEDLIDLFVRPFYFGCEADDRTIGVAFDRRMNHFHQKLKPVFGSDIGHWDVPDVTEVLPDAWSLVEDGVVSEEDFRDFVFTNGVRLHGGMNPRFFEGTVLETAAAGVLRQESEGVAG